jgi:glycosyltransferase involved in cell wall biosynthesis
MSSKKVIVCSNFKVVYEALNEECAVLVDSSNIDAWESAIKDLIINEEKREKLSDNAYNRFLQNFTWKSRAENILNFILKQDNI